ncbi:hypothetical protein [Actinoplanes sp. DH11]|uniref:hypothetical protein n=1 Tax=Actinoplanes sp. DH11 TaxID=2857011 RepID=UPI001E484A4A|nr:hypothetical protein [Actinoplanes sp. DH11]
MRYYRRLAYHLRGRGLSETRIVRILSEVRDLSAASARAPLDEFGPTESYAATFGRGGVRWPLSRWAIWGVRLAAGGFVILNIELRRHGGQTLLPWWVVLGVWVAVLAAGELGRYALDHRLPRDFTRAAVPAPSDPSPAPVAATPEKELGGYYRSLAFHLRLRHLPEPEVTRILADVHDLARASGSAPAAEFGPAPEYAETFDSREQRYRLSHVVFLGCFLAGVLLVVGNMAGELRGGDRLLPPGPTLLTLAALFAGGATFAVLFEHRLPRAFRRSHSARPTA